MRIADTDGNADLCGDNSTRPSQVKWTISGKQLASCGRPASKRFSESLNRPQ